MTKGTDEPVLGGDYTRRDGFRYTPNRFVRAGGVLTAAGRRELSAWGLTQAFGLAPGSTLGRYGSELVTRLSDDAEFWRYQYDVVYVYPSRGPGGDNEYYPVEFRCYIHTLGEPSTTLTDHFSTDNARLQQLFDEPPYQGFFRGFGFVDKVVNEEKTRIAADEASNIGIPQFEVLIHKGDNVEGQAGGYFDPFEIAKRVPKNERFNVTFNEARDDYEIRPQGRARQRLQEDAPKEVYLNGKYIGSIQPSRGTVYLAREYSSNDNTWKDSRTGKQMWSREKFIETGLANPQAIAANGSVWKVNETQDKLFLVATKPDDFDPTPEDVIPTGDDAVSLRLADATTFDVRVDEGPMMGKLDTPVTRTIRRGTDLLL